MCKVVVLLINPIQTKEGGGALKDLPRQKVEKLQDRSS